MFYFDTPDRNGCKYAIIVIDEFSGYMWVRIVATKKDVAQNIIELVRYVEKVERTKLESLVALYDQDEVKVDKRQPVIKGLRAKIMNESDVLSHDSSAPVRVTAQVVEIRCDGAGENIPTQLRKFCKRKGIRLEVTAAYCPQQNGRAERNGGALVDTAE